MATKKSTEKDLPKIEIDQLKPTTEKKPVTKKTTTRKTTAKKTTAAKKAEPKEKKEPVKKTTVKKTVVKKDGVKKVAAGTKKVKRVTKKETNSQTTTVSDLQTAVVLDKNTITSAGLETIPKPIAPIYTAGEFHKVSFEQFVESFKPIYTSQLSPEQVYSDKDVENAAKVIYDLIRLPERATAGSNGYDFFFPFGDTEIAPGQSIIIPTGIKVKLNPGWALLVYSRSSLGFNYRVLIEENVAVIDEDYFDNINNEGHIFIKIINDNREGQTVTLRLGAAFCQGLFTLTGRAANDNVTAERIGGIGSTNK